MKEFHIVSTGVSLITNAQRKNVIESDIKIADENKWKLLLENPQTIEKLKDFIRQNPRQSCAELNTLLRVIEGKITIILKFIFLEQIQIQMSLQEEQ